MTDKSTLLKAFNKHLFDFVDDIISIIEDNKDIVHAKSSLETIKRANPTMIIKIWYNFVYVPYKDIIDGGNMNFFLEKDYGNDIQKVANSDEILKIIEKLRNPIKDMSDVNKEHSMKFIQNLSKLSMMYNTS
jgi:hypothetical protein